MAAEVFDHVWTDVVKILETLIRKHWEITLAEGQKPKEKLKAAGNKSPPVFLSHVNTDVSSVPRPEILKLEVYPWLLILILFRFIAFPTIFIVT